MSTEVHLVGGPLDGHRANLPSPAAWLWVQPTGLRRQPFFHNLPAKDRLPYSQSVWYTTCWLYQGHLFTFCGDCGVFHARRDLEGQRLTACQLCGGQLGVEVHG